jgi:predicted O-methyltransferase YrrM
MNGPKAQVTYRWLAANVSCLIEIVTNTLASPRLDAVLRRLFAAAAKDGENDAPDRSSWARMTAAELADARENVYIPISAEGGKLLYGLVRAMRPETVVEFGASYGISTLYLAAAAADNGTGHVFTTELSKKKAAAARANLDEAGVGTAVTVLPGDALETLTSVPGPIGLALLDGWKDLYLPVLRLLEAKLAPGAIVAADDTTFAATADYLAYVRDPANGYVSVAFPVEDGMEISSWTASAS